MIREKPTAPKKTTRRRYSDEYRAEALKLAKSEQFHPCAPIIREVPPGTEGALATLADTKNTARQVLQAFIAEAQKLLVALRQLGISDITYISL